MECCGVENSPLIFELIQGLCSIRTYSNQDLRYSRSADACASHATHSVTFGTSVPGSGMGQPRKEGPSGKYGCKPPACQGGYPSRLWSLACKISNQCNANLPTPPLRTQPEIWTEYGVRQRNPGRGKRRSALQMPIPRHSKPLRRRKNGPGYPIRGRPRSGCPVIGSAERVLAAVRNSSLKTGHPLEKRAGPPRLVACSRCWQQGPPLRMA